MKLKNLSYRQFQEDAESLFARASRHFAKSYPDSFLRAYPEFLKYFEDIKKQGPIERHHLVIASHFVYGWMPSFVHLDLGREQEVLQHLNSALQGRRLRSRELEAVKRSINNSMSGVSKLLHFINPREYAFWDRRVFSYLAGQRGQFGLDQPEVYIEYLAGLKSIIGHEEYAQLHLEIEAHFGHRMYPMRAVEIVMFETDRNRVRASLV